MVSIEKKYRLCTVSYLDLSEYYKIEYELWKSKISLENVYKALSGRVCDLEDTINIEYY